jgi:hypothetical protein
LKGKRWHWDIHSIILLKYQIMRFIKNQNRILHIHFLRFSSLFIHQIIVGQENDVGIFDMFSGYVVRTGSILTRWQACELFWNLRLGVSKLHQLLDIHDIIGRLRQNTNT